MNFSRMEEMISSARITAGAYGRAYVAVTVSTPDGAAGGRLFVRRDGIGHYSRQPYRDLFKVHEDGSVEPMKGTL